MAKGEIACFGNFSFGHYVFKKLSAAEASESIYMRERFTPFPTYRQFIRPLCDDIENIGTKGEIYSNVCHNVFNFTQ